MKKTVQDKSASEITLSCDTSDIKSSILQWNWYLDIYINSGLNQFKICDADTVQWWKFLRQKEKKWIHNFKFYNSVWRQKSKDTSTYITDIFYVPAVIL